MNYAYTPLYPFFHLSAKSERFDAKMNEVYSGETSYKTA